MGSRIAGAAVAGYLEVRLSLLLVDFLSDDICADRRRDRRKPSSKDWANPTSEVLPLRSQASLSPCHRIELIQTERRSALKASRVS